MAGIFDRLNHPGTGENEVTVAPAFVCGVLAMKVAGVRTNAQLLATFNEELSPGDPLDAAAIADLTTILTYIDLPGTVEEKISRLQRFGIVAGIWEQGWASITEAEARTMTGATFV